MLRVNPYQDNTSFRANLHSPRLNLSQNDFFIKIKNYEKNKEYIKTKPDVKKDSYTEGIYKQPVKNIIDFEKTLTVDEAVAHAKKEDEAKEKQKKSFFGKKKNKIDDVIDHSVGVVLRKKVGDKVVKGDVIATIYANEKGIDIASKMVIDAYTMSKEEVKNRDVILKVVR